MGKIFKSHNSDNVVCGQFSPHLYGTLISWIVTCIFYYWVGNTSRNFDSFGGLITFGIIWLFVVFPFDFAYFADVLAEGIRFLVK